MVAGGGFDALGSCATDDAEGRAGPSGAQLKKKKKFHPMNDPKYFFLTVGRDASFLRGESERERERERE